MYSTIASSKNFTIMSIIKVSIDNISDIRIFIFAKNADTKNRKNKELVSKVNFEFDDHLIL